ncbi:MAG: phosphomethylpyrimidine synthase ThiC [Candidatus Omnitrophota bacterium]
MFKKSFIKLIAKLESVTPSFLERKISQGLIVIPNNKKRNLARPCAIGDGLRIKINTNIGISTAESCMEKEINKLKIALSSGSDTVMDLSVGKNTSQVRKQIIENCPVALGTVPIYEIAALAQNQKGGMEKFNFDDIWNILNDHAKNGVDFFTLHAGMLRKNLSPSNINSRIGGIVSRGGALLTKWMLLNKRENPFYANFDKILELAKEYNITLSLGDGLRPGAIADSSDRLQISELKVLGELVKRCRKNGVQAMVEGPGHIRLDEIVPNIKLAKKICLNAPLYVLGPLPLDIASGYDHISAAIGSTFAALSGANFLCVVTPAEHLSHPSLDDIKEGVMASRIAAHCVDAIRFKKEWEKDYRVSQYRAKREWEKVFSHSIDREKAKAYRQRKKISSSVCTMCGDFCSLKINEECGIL